MSETELHKRIEVLEHLVEKLGREKNAPAETKLSNTGISELSEERLMHFMDNKLNAFRIQIYQGLLGALGIILVPLVAYFWVFSGDFAALKTKMDALDRQIQEVNQTVNANQRVLQSFELPSPGSSSDSLTRFDTPTRR